MTLAPWSEAQWKAAAKHMTPKRLRTLRTDRGLSLEQVGQAIGVTKAAVSRWENDVRVIPKVALRPLYELFDLPEP